MTLAQVKTWVKSLRWKKVKLLDLWDRADDTARTLVLAGLSAVVDDSECSAMVDE